MAAWRSSLAALSRGRRAALIGYGALAVGVLVLVTGLALGVVRPWPGSEPSGQATPSPSISEAPTESALPSPTAAGQSASASPSVSATPSGPEQATAQAPEPSSVSPPARVTSVSASPGGGSGEVIVQWEAVEGATGYRVYRASSPDGDFVRSASIDVDTGATHIYFGGSYEYIQIWQPSPTSFEYVESIDGAAGYFKVAAFNDGGTGPKSGVVCASPPPNAGAC